jgi:rhodanese-related sulfurtransferase
MSTTQAASTTPAALAAALDSERPPLLIDVRGADLFLKATDWIRGALRRDPERVADWAPTLPAAASVVVYCVRGHDVSRAAARALAERGLCAEYLQGGLEAWRAAGGSLATKPAGASTRWVTRERPKIDRIACPWLVLRFVDPQAEFLYVPPAEVLRAASEREAVPYDVPDVELSHDGELCSFDAFLAAYRLHDPALAELALIVRGADTDCHELAPQAAGLAALSLGLSRLYPDDHEMLAHGFVMYDALYSWCKEGMDEVHTWNPEALAAYAGEPRLG